jgi:uncharacterized membrane protein YedE/YeeE
MSKKIILSILAIIFAVGGLVVIAIPPISNLFEGGPLTQAQLLLRFWRFYVVGGASLGIGLVLGKFVE